MAGRRVGVESRWRRVVDLGANRDTCGFALLFGGLQKRGQGAALAIHRNGQVTGFASRGQSGGTGPESVTRVSSSGWVLDQPTSNSSKIVGLTSALLSRPPWLCCMCR